MLPGVHLLLGGQHPQPQPGLPEHRPQAAAPPSPLCEELQAPGPALQGAQPAEGAGRGGGGLLLQLPYHVLHPGQLYQEPSVARGWEEGEEAPQEPGVLGPGDRLDGDAGVALLEVGSGGKGALCLHVVEAPDGLSSVDRRIEAPDHQSPDGQGDLVQR